MPTWAQIQVYDASCAFQVNPPYYVKLVELVPHPETAAAVMDTTHALMTKVKSWDYTPSSKAIRKEM